MLSTTTKWNGVYPVINRLSNLHRTLYISGRGREIVEVKLTDPRFLEFYKNFLSAVEEGDEIEVAYNFARTNIRYSEKGVTGFLSELLPGTILPLSYFLEIGEGLCGHQALGAGGLLEKDRQDRIITGVVRLNRYHTIMKNGEAKKHFGHAWIRYESSEKAHFENPDEDTVIIDPAMRFFGNLTTTGNQKTANGILLREMYENPIHDEK